ncbi:MAG: hypothetical protein A2Y33_06385 [Spirochaetes bacterium GWF1_51_8]|nr:MAG: hypothetical protein A2Y33_06385 [Spirochaetes bacterium GWF1_51_8]
MDAILREVQKQKLLKENMAHPAPEREHLSVLKEIETGKLHGEIVQKLISSGYYVQKDALIEDLAMDYGHHRSIMAVGVVNDDMQFLGIVKRRELFDLLGKPFGRDVMKHKTVERIIEKVPVYNKERNIFTASDDLAQDMKDSSINYYALTDSDNRFAGIFSSKDLLIYLSSITQKDIALARSLQLSIVKEETFVDLSSFQILGASKMAKGVGGDFYSIRRYSEHRWIFAIADVSGKGVAASLVTTSISGMFEIYDFKQGIPHFIQKLSDYIHYSFESQKFVTGLFADFDDRTGHITFYDMGHSYIYLFRKEKFFRLKTAGKNIPMGIEPGINAEADKLNLHKNDILIMITDGIAEQSGPIGEEYGDKRLMEIITRSKSAGIQRIKNDIFSDIYLFRGTQPQHDDMTIMLIEYK